MPSVRSGAKRDGILFFFGFVDDAEETLLVDWIISPVRIFSDASQSCTESESSESGPDALLDEYGADLLAIENDDSEKHDRTRGELAVKL